MAVASILAPDVQQLIARIHFQIMRTNEIVATTRALVRETLHTIRPRRASSKPDSLPYENDWAAPEITAHREPVRG